MVNDKERCEVVAKLRNLNERVLDCREYEHRAICTVVGCWGDGEYSDMELKDRLADLIKPEPERTCRMEHKEGTDCPFCSHCGTKMDAYTCEWTEPMEYSYPFCYACGAKVVE